MPYTEGLVAFMMLSQKSKKSEWLSKMRQMQGAP
jgi:hypothetical protein